jgi:hypothetical protein
MNFRGKYIAMNLLATWATVTLKESIYSTQLGNCQEEYFNDSIVDTYVTDHGKTHL